MPYKNEVDLARALVSTPSPSGQESPAARLLVEAFNTLGFDEAWTDEAGNAIGAIRRGPGKTVMFNGHIDTVPVGDESLWPYPPLAGAIEGGELWGRGSVDMKSAIACMAFAALDVAADGFAGTILVTGVVLEEKNGLGARHLAATQKADVVVLGEPSDLKLMLGHRGRVEVQVRFPGKIAHAAKSTLGSNALLRAARFLVALEALELPGGGPLGYSTATPTRLHVSPDSANVVPGEATLYIDYRYVPGDGPDEITRRLGAIDPEAGLTVRSVTATSENGAIREDVMVHNPVWHISAAHPAVESARAAAAAQLAREGMELEEGNWWFATDAPYLSEGGTPVIGFGPGDPELAHTTDERIETRQLGIARRVYGAIAAAALGGAEGD